MATTGGYRSFTGVFEGGANSPIPIGGYFSFEALWIGGSGYVPFIPPPNPPSGGGGSGINFRQGSLPVEPHRHRRSLMLQRAKEARALQERIAKDDQEVLDILGIILKWLDASTN